MRGLYHSQKQSVSINILLLTILALTQAAFHAQIQKTEAMFVLGVLPQSDGSSGIPVYL